MILAKVVGNVVATRKDPRLEGRKLLVIQTVAPDGEPKPSSYLISIDTVGAGVGDTVLSVSGSSARMAEGMKETPVDAAIIGIVDKVDIDAPPKPKRKKAG